MIERLDWDSTFFKFEVGKIYLSENTDVNEVLNNFNKSPFELVYLFTNPANGEVQKELKRSGLEIADQKVLFAKSILNATKQETSVVAINEMIPGILELAYQSGEYSRFKKDQRLDVFFKPLYKLWIENSLNGNFDDEVFVVKNNENVLQGLLTIKKAGSTGKIGLLAVNRNSRRSGVGEKLINQSEYWCFKHHLNELEVVTQMDNKPGFKFYIDRGFTVKKTENIYHLWK